jgi:superfamily II helicase
MSQTIKLIEERIRTVTSEDHFSETHGNGQINLNEDRFIEIDGHILRHTKIGNNHSVFFKALRKGDKFIERVYAQEGSSILDITYERL